MTKFMHIHPKITHPYQNHYTPMPKHQYFSHTLSTLVHTKNQAQPCHKSPIISSHHFMQCQYQTITPRPNHMSSLSKYAPIKTHIKLHSNTHSFMTNQPKSTQNLSHYQSKLINNKNHHMHLPYQRQGNHSSKHHEDYFSTIKHKSYQNSPHETQIDQVAYEHHNISLLKQQ